MNNNPHQGPHGLPSQHRPNEASTASEGAEACHRQAQHLAGLGRVAEAEQVYRQGLERLPQAFELRLQYARFKFERGRAVEALKDLSELLERDAQSAEVWLLGGELCLSHPQFYEVAKTWTFEAARLLPGDARIAALRQRVLSLTGAPAGPGPQSAASGQPGNAATAPASTGPAKASSRISFVLGATRHGPMIFSRLDANYYQQANQTVGYGVGFQLMDKGEYDPEEVALLKRLLVLRREYFKDGVVALDCGANIGVHAVEWGRLMLGWGSVLAFEAQEKIYYALAGNIILNNLMNVRAIHAAISDREGSLDIPQPDYMVNSSFGSFELRKGAATENIGQAIDYENRLVAVRAVSIDSLNLPRVDLIKLDVEGMEALALAGARQTIERCKPIVSVEIVKSDRQQIAAYFAGLGYVVLPAGLNVLAIHKSDPVLKKIGK